MILVNVWWMLLLGHLVGDYLLQPQWMAEQKSQGKWGLGVSLVHSLIYTASICTFLWSVNPYLVLGVFFSHWPIDRYSLADKWLTILKGRRISEAMFDTTYKREARIAFACIVYVVVDNAIHLLLMTPIVYWVGNL